MNGLAQRLMDTVAQRAATAFDVTLPGGTQLRAAGGRQLRWATG